MDVLAPDEGARLRAIRLRALQDAPDSFSATLAEATARAPEGWARQVVDLPTFVAVSDGADVGMVRCVRDSRTAGTAWLISMWVAPEIRRQGVGGALVDAVVGWARARGVSRLLLDVADHNVPAIELYARKGFVPNGVTSAMPPPREHVREHQRELRL
jgi:GNAT superfamily N-acetyltransferase